MYYISFVCEQETGPLTKRKCVSVRVYIGIHCAVLLCSEGACREGSTSSWRGDYGVSYQESMIVTVSSDETEKHLVPTGRRCGKPTNCGANWGTPFILRCKPTSAWNWRVGCSWLGNCLDYFTMEYHLIIK